MALAVMMVATRSMNMAVRQFFLRCSANTQDFDREVQMLAGKRMVAIDGDHIARNLRDRYRARPVIGLCLKLHPDLDVGDAREGTAWYSLDERLILLAISIGGGDSHLQFIAGSLTLKFAFETRNQVAMTLQIGKRITAGGAIEHLACVVGECVVN